MPERIVTHKMFSVLLPALLYLFLFPFSVSSQDVKVTIKKKAEEELELSTKQVDSSLIVGVVDERRLTRGRLDEEVQSMLREEKFPDDEKSYARRKQMMEGDILEEWIKTTILAEEARRRGIDLTDVQLRQKLKRLEAQQKVESLDLSKLNSLGVSEAQFLEKMKDAFLSEIVVNMYIEERFPDEKLREVYEKNPTAFRVPPMIRASQIFKSYRDKEGKERDITSMRNDLEKLRKKALRGADFAKLAQEESEILDKEKGGDLGWLSTASVLPANKSKYPQWQSIFFLKKGEVSEILPSKNGLHLVKVIDRKETGVMKFEEIKPMIVNTFFESARTALLREVRKKHFVVTNLSGLTGEKVEELTSRLTRPAP